MLSEQIIAAFTRPVRDFGVRAKNTPFVHMKKKSRTKFHGL
jgi:hypothetical protein